MLMAYANKYYDPVKAHEYYLRTRQLKGYKNRYGGSRGDGTSAASGGSMTSKEYRKQQKEKTKEYNDQIKAKQTALKEANKNKINSISDQISNLRADLAGMSTEDRAKYSKSINRKIDSLRREILRIKDKQADDIQELRTQTKGGSQAGFNEKGKQAVKDLKERLKEESKQLTKKVNRNIDDQMLADVRRFHGDVKALREKGIGFSRAQFKNRFNGFKRQARQARDKALTAQKAEFHQKYKDEIDNLRKDETNFDYYDKKKSRDLKRKDQDVLRKIKYDAQDKKDAEREAKKREKEEERRLKKEERERQKAEKEAEKERKRREKEASKSSKSKGSTKSKKSVGSTKSEKSTGSFLGYYKTTRGREYVGKYK